MPSKSGLAKERQSVIEAIIRRHKIGNQSELVAKLEERGIQVTQSSVSRDLREMGVIRVEGRYLPASALSGNEPHRAELKSVADFIVDVTPAGPCLLVIKTPPGLAAFVGIAVDHAAWSEAIGTVAGDDTVFLATAGHRQQKIVQARLAVVIKEASGG